MFKIKHLLWMVPMTLLLGACNFPRAGATPTISGPEMVLTYAAQTIEAQLTLAATAQLPTATASPPAPATGTLPPVASPTAGTPAPSPTSAACDRAGFDKDITVPDDTVFSPGTEFIKTWRLRNTGTCTWNSAYAIVFQEGDSLGSPPSAPLTSGTVAPGETVDISLTLKAPEQPGTYQGFFNLRNSGGQIFGLGDQGDKNFWVKIRVQAPSGIRYDFNVQAKAAIWVSIGGGSENNIPFDGPDDDPNGVAKIKRDITLENGRPSGVILVTGPKQVGDGQISGTFPEYTIERGDHFKAKLGFPDRCGNGQVIFRFGFKEGGNTQVLQEWRKACDGTLLQVDVDLTSFAGRKVQFVLTVLADGSPENDLVVWGSARIERD